MAGGDDVTLLDHLDRAHADRRAAIAAGDEAALLDAEKRLDELWACLLLLFANEEDTDE